MTSPYAGPPTYQGGATASGPGSNGPVYRWGDLATSIAAVIVLVASLLPWFRPDGITHQNLWHKFFLLELFLCCLAPIACAVIGPVLGSRRSQTSRIGVTWTGWTVALSGVAIAALLLFRIAYSDDGFQNLSFVLTLLADMVIFGASLALALAPAGTGFAGSVAGAGSRQPAPGGWYPPATQQVSGGWAPMPAPVAAESAAPPPFAVAAPEAGTSESPHAPGAGDAAHERTVDRSALKEAVAASGAATAFEPYWAGVLTPVQIFAPEASARKVGQIAPGQWYLVVATHALGVIVDLDGRSALVKDVAALVRG